MNKEQEYFLKELAKIQDEQVNILLIQKGETSNNELRSELESFSYEIIYRIMDLLDGYYNSEKKYEIKNVNTNTILNDKLGFHDLCEKFLKPC